MPRYGIWNATRVSGQWGVEEANSSSSYIRPYVHSGCQQTSHVFDFDTTRALHSIEPVGIYHNFFHETRTET